MPGRRILDGSFAAAILERMRPKPDAFAPSILTWTGMLPFVVLAMAANAHAQGHGEAFVHAQQMIASLDDSGDQLLDFE